MVFFHVLRLITISLMIALATTACNFKKSPELLAILSLLGNDATVTYSVGGTITGLDGTIVLQNNSTDNLNISLDGTFTFSKGYTDEATYSVTILTQPTGQTCVASSNVGAISSANVVDIVITCTTNQYTLGGTVSGLVGSLTLQNNSGDNLVLTTNGSFTFSTNILYGNSYLVTVLTQPATVTCSISNYSGIMGASNVTNVTVICSNASYSVGGSVNGLSGNLVLQNNGGDNLTLSADGIFNFATNVADSATYTVTVLTQPTSQTCTIVNSTGTISGSNITNVSITCTTNTYTVGGSLSGLSGSITIQNNGGDNLVLTTNGSFVFPTSLQNAINYSVTILSQPGGQTCSISNSSGTINSTNITNVNIVCSSVVYTVGGSVSGLVGNLTLQNNNTDDIVLNSDGNFTFPTSIANNASYSVTVLTQPTNLNCVITNGSGTVSSGNATNISVTCIGNANGALVSGTIINPLTFDGSGVTTFTGGSSCLPNSSCTSNSGFADSNVVGDVRFNNAEGITTDGTFIYVADKTNQRIRKVSIATGETTTLAGNGTKGLLNGTGTSARFDDPKYIVTDGVNLYVADKANKAIRKIVISTGVVTTIISGNNNLGDPKGLAIHNNKLYVGDNSNNKIHSIDLSTNALSTVISSGINDPVSMTVVGDTIYFLDKNTRSIKKATIGTWTVTTFVGSGTSGYEDGVGTVGVKFNSPEFMTTDGTNLYVSDTGNNRIRQVSLTTGAVTTIAGSGTASYTNSSTYLSATFNNPRGIVSDGQSLYVLDNNNHTIRKID